MLTSQTHKVRWLSSSAYRSLCGELILRPTSFLPREVGQAHGKVGALKQLFPQPFPDVQQPFTSKRPPAAIRRTCIAKESRPCGGFRYQSSKGNRAAVYAGHDQGPCEIEISDSNPTSHPKQPAGIRSEAFIPSLSG